MPEWMGVFHALPYPLKKMAAGAQGRLLQRRRYGPETDGLVCEARARERWTESELEVWQQRELQAVLERASASVPHYRARVDADHLGGDPHVLSSWPVLSKETVRSDPGPFVADGLNSSRLHGMQTSGSTGTPITVYVSTADLRRWYALSEARWLGWNGVGRLDRWAILGGRMVAAPGRSRPPFWVWNAPMRQLYLSSYHLAPSTVRDYCEAMRRHEVVYLLGYPSAIAELARGARETAVTCPPLKVVISNAEPLLPGQRKTIQEAFGCPVRDTYGMAEMVAAAGECERGSLHLWPEVGVVEVLDDNDRPVPPGETGRLVCTGLLNQHMPLIRYDVGDRGALAPPGEQCDCGRTLPILKGVEGRLDDVVITRDGRRIGRLDTVFKTDMPIRVAQIVQEKGMGLIVKVVPAPGYGDDTRALIKERLQDRVGVMDIDIREVPSIPRGAAGKLRGVISKLPSHGTRAG
jgi:phenylacetate-CoA ligase